MSLLAFDVIDRQARRQKRVFAHVFKIAAAQRRALNIHRRSKHDVFAAMFCLLADYRAVSLGQIHIPRRRKPERPRHGRGKVILVVENDTMFADLFAHTQRAVVHYQIGNAKSRNARC